LLQPHVRRSGSLDAMPWPDALIAVKSAIDAAGGPGGVRFLASAHASLEELFALKLISGSSGGATISWRQREKPQPAAVKFKIPPVDAPNVRGARDLGFDVGEGTTPVAISSLQSAVDAGQVNVLYVFDPGPDGSIGETDWILAARKAGRIAALIVQGVIKTPLAEAADIVLPGAAWVEKDAAYTNMTGHVQAASRVITPPGDAGEDWQILMKLAPVFGVNVSYRSGAAVREAIAAALSHIPAYAALQTMAFARPVSARNWLQASNPSERWKWDVMFQDVPPVKFGEEFGPLPRADVIPLKEK
jgi:NADH dehydrogenase/NADH:ubiquinone oxidoreductase subunit G